MQQFDMIFQQLIAIILGLSLTATSIAETPKVSAKPSARLSVVDTGNAHGTPVVFIHAFPMNKAMWDDQVNALKKNARVITFNIRGFGKTDAVAPYTLEFVVDDLIAVLDQLKIDKAVVCGLSMGGFVALRAVERNPERFIGLILADTKSEADSDSSKLGRYQALKQIQEQGLPSFTDSFLKSAIASVVQKEQPKVFERAKSIALFNRPEAAEAGLLALTSRTDTTAGLNEIHVPTLILQGEFDTVIPLASAKQLNEKIKGSELFIVPKAGHLSNLENPTAFNERVGKFLERFAAAK